MGTQGAKAFLLAEIQRDAIIARKEDLRAVRGFSEKELAVSMDLKRLFYKPAVMDVITELFWELHQYKLPFQVGGLATGAIPLVTAILQKGYQKGFVVNGFVVRKERKSSGKYKQMDGVLDDTPIFLVDDYLNTGHSIERIQLVLEQYNRKASYVFALVDFETPSSSQYLKQQELELFSLFSAQQDLELPLRSTSSWQEPTLGISWVFYPDNPNYAFNVPNSEPVCDDTHVYVGCSDNHFYAIEQSSGQVTWATRVGKTPQSILSSPALYYDTIFFGAHDGNFYALDKWTGFPRWVNREADSMASSPALAPDLGLLFVGAEYAIAGNRGALLALSMTTGESIWWEAVAKCVHGSPVYIPERRRVAVGTDDNSVILLEAVAGERVWEFKTQGPVKHSLAYDAERGLLCFGSLDNNIYAVDVDSGEEVFRVATENAVYATPLVVNDRLFCPSTDRNMYVIDLNSGNVIRKIRSFGKLYSSPALIHDSVFWGGNDGIFRGVCSKTLKRTQWIRVAERLLSKPTWCNGQYYINGAGGTLYTLHELPVAVEEGSS